MGPAFLYMAATVILIVSLALIVTALRRRNQNLAYGAYLASGLVSLACPVLVCAALFAAWLWQEAILLATMLIVVVLPIGATGMGVVMLLTAWCFKHAAKDYIPALISGGALLLYPLSLLAATVLGKMIL